MSKIICPDCRQLIDWPINNPDGTFCPECGGFINVVSPPADPQEVAASTTNDSQAAYGKKREPMFGEEQIDALWDFDDPPGTVAKKVSAHYESLIASGELIVKSELVEWLSERLHFGFFSGKPGERTRSPIEAGREAHLKAIQTILDHLNKKGSTTP